MSDIELKIVGAIAVAMVGACVGLFVRMRKTEANAERLEERVDNIKDDVAALARKDHGVGALCDRIAAIETEMASATATLKAMPTAREVSDIGRCVTSVQGDVKAVAASLNGMQEMMTGLNATVGALNGHLLAAARK